MKTKEPLDWSDLLEKETKNEKNTKQLQNIRSTKRTTNSKSIRKESQISRRDMDKLKLKAVTLSQNTKNVLANTQQLFMSVALVVCAYYNYATLNGDLSPFEYYTRLVSSVVLACTAAWAYWHFVKNPRS